ncbi:class I SAM-dependent methyltransferase family protein [Hyphomonas sp.]|uniref:class I SAM-dependent methyltransferase family protein n=1 Tax=Hyphomonas sp. TaxID=87 RepID=UPI00391B88FF
MYDDPSSPIARRLKNVQGQIRAVLNNSAPGPIRIVSLCAGQGRDLMEVLADHPRARDVRARLVELDPRNSSSIQKQVDDLGLDQIEVVTGDASITDHFVEMSPANLVLLCGIFGNIVDEDIKRAINVCWQLCQTRGTVIWTRHRRAPDMVPEICKWFEQCDFERIWVSVSDPDFAVGAHRFSGRSQPLVLGEKIFDFLR